MVYKTNMVLSSGGVIMGLSILEVSMILGIVYTAINLGILLFTLGRNIYKRIKDGKLDKDEIEDTKQDVKELLNTIDELREQLNEVKEHKDGTNI